MTSTGSRFHFKIAAPLLVFSCLGLLLYVKILFNDFSADDFRALYRAGVRGEIFVNGFYRPLSDLSIFLTYRVAGANPFWFHLTNVLVHILNGVMVFKLCSKLQDVIAKQPSLTSVNWFAALLFICFPFHNEGVVWIVGRGASFATFFALIMLLMVMSEASLPKRILIGGFVFFLGLQAYESILILPAIVLIISRVRGDTWKVVMSWLMVSVLVVALYLVCRYSLAGSITGEYRLDLLDNGVKQYCLNFIKAAGRLILPPSDKSGLVAALFGGFVLLYVANRILVWKTHVPGTSKSENLLLLLIFISLLVPAYFPVSTRTSEGDRLLYFPSIFLCCFIAFFFNRILRNVILRLSLSMLMLAVAVFFLQLNNANWVIASAKGKDFLKQLQSKPKPAGRVYLCNIPGELNGAFVFRNVMEDVLMIRKMDTTSLSPVNYINYAEQKELQKMVIPAIGKDTIAFSPSIKLYGGQLVKFDYEALESLPDIYTIGKSDEIWFWNNKSLSKFDRTSTE